MKRILYLSNIEVPYRVRFFNELAKYCELTVLYERQSSANRDSKWTSSEESAFRRIYLKGIPLSNEGAFSLGILKHVAGKYDAVIVGCFNSPVQAMAILFMKLLRISYYVNVDGEVFLNGSGLKTSLKRLILRGGRKYLAAGEKAAASLACVAGKASVIPYYFSSLSEDELRCHKQESGNIRRGDTVLVVGQYFDYKGMDVALEAAKLDKSIPYKFVGMGKRTELFQENCHADEAPNAQIVPFLQKQELEREYMKCAMLVLPSRQECWGLVVNEAASFGTPVVSTWGSGAAVELIAEQYPQYLAKPSDPESLLACIRRLRADGNAQEYGLYLQETASRYSIESKGRAHLGALDIEM